MQAEMASIVFAQARAPAAAMDQHVRPWQERRATDPFGRHTAEADSGAVGVYGSQWRGEDTRGHFEGSSMAMDDIGESTTRLEKQKPVGSSEYMNDRREAFDPVYGTQWEGEDTRDHFGNAHDGSMALADGARDAHEAYLERLAHERAALQKCGQEEATRPQEQTHMGHEQQGGAAGDTYDHFKGGSMAWDSAKFSADDLRAARALMGHEQQGGAAGDTYDHFKGGSLAWDSTKFDVEALRSSVGGLATQPFYAPRDLPPKLPGAAKPPSSAASSAASRGASRGRTPPPLPRRDAESALHTWNVAARLPDFADPRSPASLRYLRVERTPERIAARAAAQRALPAAGAPSNHRNLRRAASAASLTLPFGTPSSVASVVGGYARRALATEPGTAGSSTVKSSAAKSSAAESSAIERVAAMAQARALPWAGQPTLYRGQPLASPGPSTPTSLPRRLEGGVLTRSPSLGSSVFVPVKMTPPFKPMRPSWLGGGT